MEPKGIIGDAKLYIITNHGEGGNPTHQAHAIFLSDEAFLREMANSLNERSWVDIYYATEFGIQTKRVSVKLAQPKWTLNDR